VATSGEGAHAEPLAPAPQKKRGFWSRIFGKGKGENRDEPAGEAPPKKKSGG